MDTHQIVEPATKNSGRKKRFALSGAAIATVAALVAGGAWTVNSAHTREEAREAYRTAQSSEEKAFAALTSVIDLSVADQEGCEESVANTDVCEALATTITNAQAYERLAEIDVEKSTVRELTSAQAKLEESAAAASTEMSGVTLMRRAISESQNEKVIASAQETLESALSAATKQYDSTRSLIAESEGKVKTNTPRQEAKDSLDSLKSTIDGAQKLISSRGVTALNEAATSLQTKTKALASQHSALQTAIDDFAAAQAEAANSGSTGTVSNGGSGGSTWSGSGSSSSGGSTWSGSGSSSSGGSTWSGSGSGSSSSGGSGSGSGGSGSSGSGSSSSGGSGSGSGGSGSSGSGGGSSTTPAAPWTAASQDAILNAATAGGGVKHGTCSAIGAVKSSNGAAGILASTAHRAIVARGSYVVGTVYLDSDGFGGQSWHYSATVYGCAG